MNSASPLQAQDDEVVSVFCNLATGKKEDAGRTKGSAAKSCQDILEKGGDKSGLYVVVAIMLEAMSTLEMYGRDARACCVESVRMCFVGIMITHSFGICIASFTDEVSDLDSAGELSSMSSATNSELCHRIHATAGTG
jgi:hypothetical protein